MLDTTLGVADSVHGVCLGPTRSGLQADEKLGGRATSLLPDRAYDILSRGRISCRLENDGFRMLDVEKGFGYRRQ
jgi:hypothetical protein